MTRRLAIGRSVAWLRALLVCVVAIAANPASALDPNYRLSQSAHHIWHVGDNGLDAPINAIAQSKEGYLLVTTNAGLRVFDGTRFRTPEPGDVTYVPKDVAYSLFVSHRGDIYLRESNTLLRNSNGRVAKIGLPGEAGAPQGDFVELPDGTVVTTSVGRFSERRTFCLIRGTRFDCPLPEAARSKLEVGLIHMALAPDGALWFVGTKAIYRIDAARNVRTFKLPLGTSEGGGLAIAPNGTIWLGFSHGITSTHGLMRLDHTRPVDVMLPGLNGAALDVSAMYVDSRGDLWVGTADHGVYRIHDRSVDHFDVQLGLSGNAVAAIYEDREHSIWVATDKGLDQFTDKAIMSFGADEGVPSQVFQAVAQGNDVYVVAMRSIVAISSSGTRPVFSVERNGKGAGGVGLLKDHEGRWWTGDVRSLWRQDGNHFVEVKRPDGGGFSNVHVVENGVGPRVWLSDDRLVGFGNRNEIWQFDHGVPHGPWLPPAEVARFSLSLLADDLSGGLWVGVFHHGLLHMAGGRFVRDRRIPDDALVMSVTPLGGSATMVATDTGLFILRPGGATRYSLANGLPCDSVLDARIDRARGLWLVTKCGVVFADLKQSAAILAGTGPFRYSAFLGPNDGYEPNTAAYTTLTDDGRLWYVPWPRLYVVDPRHLLAPGGIPTVRLERFVVDGHAAPASSGLTLPAGARRLSIDYTGLSLVRSADIRFKYRLIGNDPNWIDAGVSRQAIFTNLSPGDYRFQVVACGRNGVCDRSGAALALTVEPAFTQTWLFRVLCGAVVLLFLWLAYRFRIAQIGKRFQLRLEERMRERERISRDLHDTLLQGFQGTVLSLWGLSERVKRRPDDGDSGTSLTDQIDTIMQRAEAALGEGRDKITQLRGDEMHDLTERLQQMIEDLRRADRPTFRLTVEGRLRTIHPIVCEELIQIAREATTNAAAHANATAIDIGVIYSRGQLMVSIEDDGDGIDPGIVDAGGRKGHFGLQGMRERAAKIGGRFSITTEPQNGTRIDVTVPALAAFVAVTGPRRWLGRLVSPKFV